MGEDERRAAAEAPRGHAPAPIPVGNPGDASPIRARKPSTGACAEAPGRRKSPMFARLPLSLLAYAAFVSLGLPDGLLGPAWPSMAGEFGQGIERLAVVLAVFTSGYLAASFGAGWLLARWPLGTILAAATGLAAGGLLGFALAPGFWYLAVAAGAAGLSGGVIDAGLNAYGAERFDRRTLNWLHRARLRWRSGPRAGAGARSVPRRRAGPRRPRRARRSGARASGSARRSSSPIRGWSSARRSGAIR